ncbi:hypothetical protein POL68_20595 [Stigmatella sp. ncwal1]|uniref:ABC transporter permease n=1 Tax=Stigmatella ashevillensis TaxID=2995309 RepID=A0ABT5DBB7_9BACT|nr:hypothetical protein [Stigmatella ashevillena]MDC0710884.1 hypothetical protein [Stigmatella ashevillena]
MIVTAKASLAPGTLAAAAAPTTVLLVSGVTLVCLGGSEAVSRVVGAAGPFTLLVVISGLVEMVFLTLMLCQASTGRVVPLAVMLGVATLPWTVGLLGTEVLVGRTVEALGTLEPSDARTLLAQGTGMAMAPRMLGAWTSAALLAGLGLGLGLTRNESELGIEKQHTPAGRTFGVIVAFVLATVAVVSALEAYRLFLPLMGLAQVPITGRAGFLEQAAEEILHLQPVRWGSVGSLAVLGGTLLLWMARGGPRGKEWMGSLILVASVTALFLLDGHPLRTAVTGARAAGLWPALPPAGFEALRTAQTSALPPRAAFATLEGLVPHGGPRLPWTASSETLASALSPSLSTAAPGALQPAGLAPEPVLPLQSDVRLAGPDLRHLIQASAQTGARSMALVGQHPDAVSPATLKHLEARLPLFALLAAQPGTLRLLFPSALPGPLALSWRARIEANTLLHLSPAAGGPALRVSLHSRPAEVPNVLAGAFVGLELSEEVSLKELGAAADVIALSGASAVVLFDSSPHKAAAPSLGDIEAQWPEPFHRVAEEPHRALETL